METQPEKTGEKSAEPPQAAKFIPASKSLQVKAGTGELPPPVLAKAENVIANNTQDFAPLAEGFIARLATGIDIARSGAGDKKHLIAGMTGPVMELKANARMFKYDLVTSLANIMLDFLETIQDLDTTAIDIVAAHHKTLSLILAKKMSGDGGAMGPVLQRELQSAIQRYFAQKK